MLSTTLFIKLSEKKGYKADVNSTIDQCWTSVQSEFLVWQSKPKREAKLIGASHLSIPHGNYSCSKCDAAKEKWE
jgi:hypothetical protein